MKAKPKIKARQWAVMNKETGDLCIAGRTKETAVCLAEEDETPVAITIRLGHGPVWCGCGIPARWANTTTFPYCGRCGGRVKTGGR